tara:strand:- start:7 stop:180 length:174 start_codon:yes stop_codon:yes gene_type:complete
MDAEPFCDDEDEDEDVTVDPAPMVFSMERWSLALPPLLLLLMRLLVLLFNFLGKSNS